MESATQMEEALAEVSAAKNYADTVTKDRIEPQYDPGVYYLRAAKVVCPEEADEVKLKAIGKAILEPKTVAAEDLTKDKTLDILGTAVRLVGSARQHKINEDDLPNHMLTNHKDLKPEQIQIWLGVAEQVLDNWAKERQK